MGIYRKNIGQHRAMGNWIVSLKETRQGIPTVPLVPIREFDTHNEVTFLWYARNGYKGGYLPDNRYDVVWRMLERLQDGQWISNDIMWAYTSFQQRRIDEARTTPKYHIMSPSFFRTVITEYNNAFLNAESPSALDGMKQLAERANLALDGNVHRIFIPYEDADNHWILLFLTITYHTERNAISCQPSKFDPSLGHREADKYEGGDVPDFDDQFDVDQEAFEIDYIENVPRYEGDVQTSAIVALFLSLPNRLPDLKLDKYPGRCIHVGGRSSIPANCGYWVLGFIDELAFDDKWLTNNAEIPSYRKRVRNVVTDELRTAFGVSNIADVAFDFAQGKKRAS